VVEGVVVVVERVVVGERAEFVVQAAHEPSTTKTNANARARRTRITPLHTWLACVQGHIVPLAVALLAPASGC